MATDQVVEFFREHLSSGPHLCAVERNGEPPAGFYDDDAPVGEPPPEVKDAPAVPARRVWTPAERIAVWRQEGPLRHEATGVAKLDELTGGGPVYGSRWYLLGAPDAGKTGLLVQLADEWQRRSVVVGILAVDEEADDLTTRLAQRARFLRQDCEARSEETLRDLEDAMAEVKIRMYGAEWTIEAAAEDLAKHAGGSRVAFFVDSVQQASSNAMLVAERELSERQVVNLNVRALRSVASAHRMIVVATSEMNRQAYRSVKAAEESNDMAAAKESGSVEFSARVMLSLRSVKDEGDRIAVRMVKNKHGPSYPGAEDFFLALDRRHQTLTTCDAPPEVAKGESRSLARKAEHVKAAARVAEYLARHPGDGTRSIQSGLRRALGGCPDKLALDAVALLVEAGAIVTPEMKRGQARPHWLDGSKLPAAVLAEVALEQRPAVVASRPRQMEET
jgi:KaiC/GvpD/RAD55 family RecA-like ATPase